MRPAAIVDAVVVVIVVVVDVITSEELNVEHRIRTCGVTVGLAIYPSDETSAGEKWQGSKNYIYKK